jgi:hypothetical protein
VVAFSEALTALRFVRRKVEPNLTQ